MRRVVRVLLMAFAFAVPWEYSLDIGEPFGNIARIAGLVLLLAAIPAVLLGCGMRVPGAVQWLVLALFIWLCCTGFWTIDAPATWARLRGYFQVMRPVWLVWEFAESADDLRDLLRACVAGSWILAALTIASLASPEAGQIRFVAEGQDPNDVARFLDLGFPMAALLQDAETRWPGRLLAYGFLPVGFTAVLLTASRGGFLAALLSLAGCALLMARRHPRALLASTLCLPVVALGFWSLVPRETVERIHAIPEQLAYGDLNQRLNIWQAGWHAFVRAPLLGSGAGTFVDAAGLASIDTAHNTALALAVEGGVIAMILASAVVASCARSLLEIRGQVRIALATALLVWAVTALVASVDVSRSTWMLMSLIALAGRLGVDEPESFERTFPAGEPV